MKHNTTTGAGETAAHFNPRAHFTLCEDGNVSVIADGLPLCSPTSFERARSVAVKAGLGTLLPVWDAQFGRFGVTWPRS